MNDRSGDKLRILVVEDDESIRGLMRDLLSMYNHEVYLAPDGENALKHLQSTEFDLLITDLGLPGMSGWELAQASQRYQTGMRVMAITSWRAADEETKSKAFGIDLVVWKPFRFEEILLALSRLFPTESLA